MLKPFYNQRLTLNNENRVFQSQLCLSNASLTELNLFKNKYLHPTEQAYHASLSHERRQYSYLMGRYCSKMALCEYKNIISYSEINIQPGYFDHPIIFHPTFNNIQLSISHTQELGGVIVFPEALPMALDIEMVAKSKIEVIKTQISENENTLSLPFLPIEEERMTLLWTVKEALSKVLRCGLTVSFELFEIAKMYKQDHFIRCHFKHFHQYQTLSFILDLSICTIVYPREIEFQLEEIAKLDRY